MGCPAGYPKVRPRGARFRETLRSNSDQGVSMPIPDTAFHDVIIAGAGPVGLFLACELRLAGVSVLVLEQAEHPDTPLKALPFGLRGLSVPTVESLDRRDLLDDLKAHM